MQIKVNDKKVELFFGVAFVRELDKIAGLKKKDVELGMGLTKSIPGLQAYDAAVLSNIIYCATVTESPRPSMKEVDAFVEDKSTDIESIFDQVQKELKESNATKLALKKMKA